MPTRAGWTVMAAALATAAVGRLFGIVELYVFAAGMFLAVALAVLTVQLRRPRLDASRWIHPSVLTTGTDGRVDLEIGSGGTVRSPRVQLVEPVGATTVARLTLEPVRPGGAALTAYRIPADRRGLVTIGPLEVERTDVLGLARTTSTAAASTSVMIAPRTFDLPMPELGSGLLGRQLLARAQRLGAGEFHGLRDYVDGDEPRTIHWRASARSEQLKVRQYTTEGLRRCIVVLDRDASTITDPGADSFERAIVAAASLVESADRSGLTTRFVTSGDVDLRGPDVATATLRVLAPIEPAGPLGHVERDPGDGLGLLIVVTASPRTPAWRRSEQLVDPALSRIGVFTLADAVHGGRLSVDATTVERFRDGWEALAGHGGLDVRSSLARHLAHVTPAPTSGGGR